MSTSTFDICHLSLALSVCWGTRAEPLTCRSIDLDGVSSSKSQCLSHGHPPRIEQPERMSCESPRRLSWYCWKRVSMIFPIGNAKKETNDLPFNSLVLFNLNRSLSKGCLVNALESLSHLDPSVGRNSTRRTSRDDNSKRGIESIRSVKWNSDDGRDYL